MGACRSKPAVKKDDELNENYSTDVDVIKIEGSENSIAGLIKTFFPIVLPIVRRVISKKLIEKGSLLLNEEPVPPVFDADMADEDLPIRPLKVHVQDVNLVSAEKLLADMKKYPNFGWPERDRVEELMNPGPEQQAGMVVFDLIKADFTVRFGPGYEFVVSVKKFGMKIDLEIGYGDIVEEGWLRFKGPLLRVWYVTETSKLYISFMERPDIIPFLNVNADRGKGDFASLNFTEKNTALDDALERVLYEFGPGLSGPLDGKGKQRGSQDKDASWIGDSLGGLIVEKLKKQGAKVQPGKPLEIDLSDKLSNLANTLLGKPRPSATIRMKIEQLNLELEKAEEIEASLLNPATEEKNDQLPVTAEKNVSTTVEENDAEKVQVCGFDFCGAMTPLRT